MTTNLLTHQDFCVQLWSGRLPWVGPIAEHCWLVLCDGQRMERWEVWQTTAAGGTSWGHVHRNLMRVDAWPHGQARRYSEWTGEVAATIVQRVRSSPDRYPWVQRYRLVPGPNSNTYVQWALGDHYRLGWRAWGKGYVRWIPTDALVF